MIQRNLDYQPAKDEAVTIYQCSAEMYSESNIEKLMQSKGITEYFIYKESFISPYAGLPGHPDQSRKHQPNTNIVYIAHPKFQND